MEKSMNKDTIFNKSTSKQKSSPIKVSMILGIPKHKPNHWRKTKIRSTQIRRKKFDDTYINKIYLFADD